MIAESCRRVQYAAIKMYSAVLFLEYEGVLDLQIQNATRPADPEEATSKPIPKPAPEHPIGHHKIPTQKDPAQNSADSQCFSVFQ